MISLGILGLGEGRSAMSAALKSDKITLKKMCDANPDMVHLRSAEFGFSNFTTSYEEMLADTDLDAVAIYTPDHLHARHIMMALEAGKHVVCTKPLINDLSEAGTLLQVAQKSQKKVFVGQSSRFFRPMIQQRADFLNGEIGEIITAEAHYHADHRWFLNKAWAREQSFKWLFGGLSHPVDLIRWYLPDVEEVMGYGMLSSNGKSGGLKNDDTMHFIMKTDSGKVARISGAYSGPVQPGMRDSEMTCILRGTEGASQADYPDLRYALTNNQVGEQMKTWDYEAGYYFRFEGRTHHAGEYQNYLEYFADCIEGGKEPFPNLYEGIKTIALLMAMDESLSSGKPVKVGEMLNRYGLKNVH